MSNPYDNSASKSYAPASTKELPKLPYDIFLLVVEAFLESAHAEISSEPASWALYLLREVFFILNYNYDGNETRKKRFRLLRGISQVDLRARRMVNQQFPRFAFMEDNHSGVQKFVHICAKVDLFAISSASCITDSLSPTVKPQFLDMLRVLENVYLVSGHFDLESLGAMPSLKSVSLLMDIDMGPHGHVRPCFVQEQAFSPWQWKAIRECSLSAANAAMMRCPPGTRVPQVRSKEPQGLTPDAEDLLVEIMVTEYAIRQQQRASRRNASNPVVG
ncbi:hypothetical protein CKAH01_12223 [Colletotrichum kahawae]|uniref:Uncharacterized protein n=1 Tax=Colletotrichum kahawae TaxID=34407 RepID=A0AAD9YVX4_COLKA|nr:hypothetical protein CKAH01_12223 [Colletotrichum kahawae]